MNLDSIRNMNDYELRSFLNDISQRNNMFCSKCGSVINTKNRKTINVSIYDKSNGQKARKLCHLCNSCYVDMLDYLGVCDIEWED